MEINSDNFDPRGLFAPSSITWKIHSDPAMAVGGIRALLQQALHPIAMDGVASNSNFREDAWGRLQRTADYVSTITYGSTEEAIALANRVRKIHSSLGLDIPHLLLWVHMSMVDSFLDISVILDIPGTYKLYASGAGHTSLSTVEQHGYTPLLVSRTKTGTKNVLNTDTAMATAALRVPVFTEIKIDGTTTESSTYLSQAVAPGVANLPNYTFKGGHLIMRRIF